MQAVSSLLFMAHLAATCQMECLIFMDGIAAKFFFFKAFLHFHCTADYPPSPEGCLGN